MTGDERKKIKESLRTLGHRPTKERGQNFLIDPSCIDSIVQFGKPAPGERIVEIGPGLGALTGELQARGPLTVIEIEEKFCRDLKQRFPSLEIIQSDVREVDFSELGTNLVVFGNLPYSFSTDIIFHLVDHHQAISRAILLLQKEFADRLAASPGGRTYGTLTISAQLFADIRSGPVFPGTSFEPHAKVDSRVVQLKFLPEPRYQVDNMFWFKRVVKAAFFKRRRKLLNSLQASEGFSDMDIAQALSQAGLSPDCRAETVDIEAYANLSNIIAAHYAPE